MGNFFKIAAGLYVHRSKCIFWVVNTLYFQFMECTNNFGKIIMFKKICNFDLK